MSSKRILSRKSFTAIASIFYPVGMTKYQNLFSEKFLKATAMENLFLLVMYLVDSNNVQ